MLDDARVLMNPALADMDFLRNNPDPVVEELTSDELE